MNEHEHEHAMLAARPPTSPKVVFSVGRQRVLRNSQQARKSGPREVKLEGKRRLTPMPNPAPGPRPSPFHHGALTPPPLSRTAWFEAVLTLVKGGQP
jgi:hypothetical protein